MNKVESYLGYVKDRKNSQTGVPIAEIYPICHAVAGQSWQPVSETERIGEFPNRGLVTWFHAWEDANLGSVWHFRIERNPTFEPENSWHDLYRIIDKASGQPTRLIEIIDIRQDDPDRARRWITEDGIRLSFIPSTSVYLVINDREWVGPVTLERHPDGLWRFPVPEGNVSPLKSVYPAPTSKIITIDLGLAGNDRIFLTPDAGTLRSQGQVDWSADAVVFRNVLNRLRSRDKEFSEQLGLTKKAISHLASVISPAIETMSLDQARIRRAVAILESLVASDIEHAEFAEALLLHPLVSARLERLVSQRSQEVEAELAVQREEFETVLNARVQAVEDAIAAKQAILAQLETEELRRKQFLEAEVTHFEDALAKRLKKLLERPADTFAEVAVLRAALQLSLPSGQTLESEIPLPVSRWQNAASVSLLDDDKKVRKNLRDACRAVGFPSLDRTIHASLLAGAMPILVGEGALTLAEAYAHVITGDRLLWVPIGPNILTPQDLLGNVDPTSGRFRPQPNGLLDLLKFAQDNPDDLFLVVLDGLNRAAIEAYLVPLLMCYQSVNRSIPRRLPLATTVNSNDPYAFAMNLQWPANVLLCGIWSEDAFQLPSPATMWHTATFLPLTLAVPNEDDEILSFTSPSLGDSFALSVPYWSAVRAHLSTIDLTPCVQLLHDLRSASLYTGHETELFAQRFYAALRATIGEAESLSELVRSVIVPRLGSNREQLLPFLEERGQLDEKTRRTIDFAQQVIL